MTERVEGEHREYLLRHWGRLAWLTRRVLELTREGDSVLEAGCAWGDVASFLQRHRREVAGVDLLHGPDQHPEFEYHAVNFETEPLPFADARFDCVIFTEVLEHFAASPLPTLKELRRVTRAGGTVLISTPNQSSIGHVGRLLLNRSNLFQSLESKIEGGWVMNKFHNHVYTRRELQVICGAAGLEARRLRYMNFLPSRGARTSPRELLRVGSGMVLPRLRTYLYGEFSPSESSPPGKWA